MMIKSLQQVESINSTIRKVDNEIVKRLKAIRRNVVPNAAIARNHVRTLQRENEQRKAVLHLNKGRIEQLYEADGGRYSKVRRTFLTPDGAKEKGNRGRPMISIEEMNRVKRSRVPLLPPTTIKPSPPTKKQRKRLSPPPKDIEVRPLPIVTPAKPPARLNEAADSVRQSTHRIGADRARAIRRVRDAKRDAELVRKGQMNLVRRRRSRELAKRRQEMKKRNIRMRNQRLEEIKRKAVNAERTARAQATSIATRNVAVRPSRSRPSARFSRGNGIVPQLALMTALNDKNRAAKVNQATRTQEVTPQDPIADQITEDVRKYKSVRKPTASSNPYDPLGMQKIVDDFVAETKEVKHTIDQGLKGGGKLAHIAKTLGPEQAKFWANKAYSVIEQVENIFQKELTRWKQGSLSAGVNISTDSRSQSSRQMTAGEFKRHFGKKAHPLVEAFMTEAAEAFKRAQVKNAKQPSNLGASRNITIHAGTQKALSGIDKLRGHGRPVLSEQQGTKGLAGLFPALRSSMQGALRQ